MSVSRTTKVGAVDGKRLMSLIERIEHLSEEKKEIAEQIKDVFIEAKSAGFDAKAMRSILKLRGMDESEREYEAAVLDTYKEVAGL